MRIRDYAIVAAFTLAMWSGGATRAATVLYDQADVVQGQQAFEQSFNLLTSGTLSITVTEIPVLDAVTNLNTFFSSATGTIGSSMLGTGTESVQVGPGTFYAHWFGDAAGTFNAGIIGVKIEFSPTTTVPLPVSWVLLLSALIALFFWGRRRESAHA